MDTLTLKRFSTLNDYMMNEYKKRLNSTVYSNSLIDKAQTITELMQKDDNGRMKVIMAYLVFNSFCGESILVLYHQDNTLSLYDLQSNQFKLKLQHFLLNNKDKEKDNKVILHHHFNTSIKIHYVLLYLNSNRVIIFKYAEGFELIPYKDILCSNTDVVAFSHKPINLYPFQLITADYYAKVNTNLSLVSFDGKELASSSSIHAMTTDLGGFTSKKSKDKDKPDIYFFTSFYQGITSFKLQYNKKIELKPYKAYSSWNKHTNMVLYFYDEKANEDYLIEVNNALLIIWEFHTGKSLYHISVSMSDLIVSMVQWNSDMFYVTTLTGKFCRVEIRTKTIVQSPIVFDDYAYISTVRIHQPALIVYINDTFQILTYDVNLNT